MKRFLIRHYACILLTGALTLAAPARSRAQAPHYILTDLGNLGGTPTVGNALDLSCDVVGYGNDSSGVTHAFLYRNGTLITLGDLGGGGGFATGINNNGIAVGYSYTSTFAPH